MNLVGRYTIKKFNKNKQKTSEKVYYNNITDDGKSVILNLLMKSSAKSFHNMHGYKVLDLKQYTIHTTFDNNAQIKYGNQDEGQNYITWFGNLDQQVNAVNSIVSFDVKSSFFHKYEYDFRYDETVSDNHDLIYTKHPSYPLICYPNFVSSNLNVSDYIQYSNYHNHDNTLLNGNSYKQDSVDKILLQTNSTNFIWKSSNLLDSVEGRKHILDYQNHNIDFFRVKCVQSIKTIANQSNTPIVVPLWKGDTKQYSKRKVTLKYDQNGLSKYCLIGRYKIEDGIQWTYFDNNQINININETDNSATVTINSSFNVSNYDIQLTYYMYYQDSQLDNGICGMYLNYQLNIDNQVKASAQFNRQLFGNGVFSYDGGKTNDEYVSYPWQGKPMKRNMSYSVYDSPNQQSYLYYYGSLYSYHNPFHYLFTSSQYIDGVNDHYYSFYPYISSVPNCFRFYLHNPQTVLSMKNILFFIPDISQQNNPRVFKFNNEDESIVLKTDANRVNIQKNVDSFKSLAQWVTHIEYQDGNDVEFTRLSMLGCKKLVLEESVFGNWNFIRPIKKQKQKQDFYYCFSSVQLKTPFKKTSQQAVQIFYQIGIGGSTNE